MGVSISVSASAQRLSVNANAIAGLTSMPTHYYVVLEYLMLSHLISWRERRREWEMILTLRITPSRHSMLPFCFRKESR